MGNKVATFTEEQLENYQDCTFFTRKEILRIFKRFREMGDPGVVPRSMTSQQASTLRIPLSCLTRIPELKENPFRQRISEVFTRYQNPGQQSRSDVSDEGICFEEFLEMMSVFSEQAPRDLKVFYAFKIYGTDHHVNQTAGWIVREVVRGRPRSLPIRTTSLYYEIRSVHTNVSREDIRVPRRRGAAGKKQRDVPFSRNDDYRFFSTATHSQLSLFYSVHQDFDEDGVLGLSDLESTCRQLVQGGLNGDEVATVCRKVLEESDIDGDGVLSYLEFQHVVTRASDFMATFHIRI